MKKHEKTWKSAIYNIAYILYIHQIITYVPISLSITSWTKLIESCGNYIDWAVRSICYHINYVVLFLAFSGCSVFGGFGHSLGISWVCMWFASHPTGPRLQHQFQTEVTWRSRMADCLRMFSHFSPHLCVGFLFLVVALPPLRSRSRPLPPPSSHTHTTRPTQLTHTHTTCPHTTCPHTTCPHTTYSHTALGDMDVAFCVAGVALIVLGWLLWRAWALLGAVVAAAVCVAGMALRDIDLHFGVAGVALRDIDLHFAWQAWHLATSTFTLRGRRCTSRHRPSLCVAGVALGDIDLHFAWQAWHLATWTCILHGRRGTYRAGLALVARLGPVGRRGRRRRLRGRHGTSRHRPSLLRGRRGTSRHRPSLCVAGVALGDMDVHSAWQMWHLSYLAGSGGALGPRWAPWSPPPFAWQAWHFATSNFTLRGRRGTYGTYNLSTFCFGSSCTYTLRIYTHAHTHTHTYTRCFMHDSITHTYTPLLRTIAYTPFTHLPSTYICCTRRSFTISYLFSAFPIPSLPFFCCLLDEVDMWGYPVL